jgi:surface antigen
MTARLPMMAVGLLALTAGLPTSAEETDTADVGRGGSSYLVWHYGQPWARDYGIARGRCHTAIVGLLARGLLNQAAGAQVGRWDDRPVAVILGPVLGSDLAGRLGRDADAADRGCLAHTLEVAPDDQAVTWSNRGLMFTVQPRHGEPRGNYFCREFVGRVHGRDVDRPFNGFACRSGRGLWRMA